MTNKFHIAIIGAGITGCFLAYLLSKYDKRVCVIEKCNDVANGCTNANSAIIHSGHDPLDNTLKAELNVLGNKLYRKYSKEVGFEFKEIGAYVVAKSKEEIDKLDEISQKCQNRNIPYEYLDGKTLSLRVPKLNKNIISGIYLPTTGVISPWKTCVSLMNKALLNGVTLYENYKVETIDKQKTFIITSTKGDVIEADIIINCAGLFGDEVARMFEPNFSHKINPRVGEYYILDKSESCLTNSIIYPVPSPEGKGVLVIPTIDGNIMLGPNSDSVEDKDCLTTSQWGLDLVKAKVKSLIDDIDFSKVIRTFCGIRPCSDTGDFIIESSALDKRFVNVIGIDSPGLASAPAIAEYVVKNFIAPLLELRAETKKIEMLQKHIPSSKYNHIVCRCEHVSEGEVIEAILKEPQARSIKAVKKRTRAGMGRCQGGFCEPEIAKIISETLQIPLSEVVYDELDSNLFFGDNNEEL